jgi:hypothetical protein
VPNFEVFNVTHDTNPKREFGSIDENGSDLFSKRFVYQLLNPQDEDVLTFITNADAPLSVFAKAEGLKIERVQSSRGKWSDYSAWWAVVGGIMAGGISLVSLLLQRLSKPSKNMGHKTRSH